MEYISSDTNVWIDYMVIDELELPFRLQVSYLMNIDAVNDELLSPKGMKEQLLKLGLVPVQLSEQEFYDALEMTVTYPRLSGYDCAALAIAKNRKIQLLTGDGALRKAATTEGVSVIGTIGILDRLLDENKISEEKYNKCLLKMIKVNGREIRLPKQELENRLKRMEE